MFDGPNYTAWSVKLLYYVAGAASTVAGSWVASKIRVYHDNRTAHLEELRRKILVPLHSGLHGYYGQLVEHRTPVVEARWGQETARPDAKVTEVVEGMGWLLQAADPRGQVESALDRALLQDARENHYRDVIRSWEAFRDAWTEHKMKCESLVSEISRRLVSESGLIPFKTGLTEGYVLHISLAAFVYMRLFGIPTSTLRVAPEGAYRFALMGNGALAIGSEEQMGELLGIVQSCADQQRKRASELQRESGRLRGDLQGLSDRISLALASRRLTRRCPLVSFF